MRIGEWKALVGAAYAKNKRLCGVGPAGIGKTQVAEEVARDMGWEYASICMPMASPVTLMGYPYRDGDVAGHTPFGALNKALHSKGPFVLIYDEIGGASNETVKAMLRQLQFGEVGDKKLPEHVRMICLSNDVGHGADVMGIIEPAKDRFHSIVNIEAHIDDTINYGLIHGWPAWELGYLRNSPDALHDLKPQKSMQRSGATPRGWDYLAQLDADGMLDMECGSELACGAVGKGRGTAAMAFRGLVNELPDVDALILDPDSAPVPENPSAKFFVAMALAGRMTAGNFGAIAKYVIRLGAMFEAYTIRDAFRAEATRKKENKLPKDHKALSSSRDFVAWATSERGKAVMAAAS